MMDSHSKQKSNPDNKSRSKDKASSTLQDLLNTSHAVKKALEPQSPRQSFIDELAENLDSNVEYARETMQILEDRKQRVKWTAIGAGAGIYIISIGIVFAKFIKWIFQRRSDDKSNN